MIAMQACDVQQWSETAMEWAEVDTADALAELTPEVFAPADDLAEALQEQVASAGVEVQAVKEEEAALESITEGFFKRPTWAIGGRLFVWSLLALSVSFSPSLCLLALSLYVAPCSLCLSLSLSLLCLSVSLPSNMSLASRTGWSNKVL